MLPSVKWLEWLLSQQSLVPGVIQDAPLKLRVDNLWSSYLINLLDGFSNMDATKIGSGLKWWEMSYAHDRQLFMSPKTSLIYQNRCVRMCEWESSQFLNIGKKYKYSCSHYRSTYIRSSSQWISVIRRKVRVVMSALSDCFDLWGILFFSHLVNLWFLK